MPFLGCAQELSEDVQGWCEEEQAVCQPPCTRMCRTGALGLLAAVAGAMPKRRSS